MIKLVGKKAEKVREFISGSYIYIITILCSIVFVGFGIYTLNRSAEAIKYETQSYISTAIEHTRFLIDEYIREKFDILTTTTAMINYHDDILNEERLYILNNALRLSKSFSGIGLIDLAGEIVYLNVDGNLVNESHMLENTVVNNFMKQVFTGHDTISEAVLDDSLNDYMMLLGVPIYDTSAVRGCLFVTISVRVFNDLLENNLFADQGISHIIKSNGDYIIRARNPLRSNMNGIFDVDPPVSSDIYNRIITDMSNRSPGIEEIEVFGEKRLISYEPLQTNDWFIFYSIAEDKIDNGMHLVNRTGRMMFIGSMIVFLVFLLIIGMINRKNHRVLEKIAFEDPITGCSNSKRFVQEAEKSIKIRPMQKRTLWICGMRDLNYIEHCLGESDFKRLLIFIADHIKLNLQEGEVLGRIRESTFVFLRNAYDDNDIEKIFKYIVNGVEEFCTQMGWKYRIELVAGVYKFTDSDYQVSLNNLIGYAEMAYSISLKRYGNDYAVFSDDLHSTRILETKLSLKMKKALQDEEFKVYFQPKVSLHNGRKIVGMEAVVRWDSPEDGLIMPSEFIDLFERNGFIIELDNYVFDRACQAYLQYIIIPNHDHIVMSVNISRAGLLMPDFIDSYTRIKTDYCIPDKCLELEFTENILFDNHELFSSLVSKLKENGFLCSMDDFGTGYSSLHSIQGFDLDTLKIDRDFFQYGENDERSRALVESIVAMGKALDLKTVAEGVDKEYIVEHLKNIGCDAIQGYVYAKPMPIEEFIAFYENWNS